MRGLLFLSVVVLQDTIEYGTWLKENCIHKEVPFGKIERMGNGLLKKILSFFCDSRKENKKHVKKWCKKISKNLKTRLTNRKNLDIINPASDVMA